MRNNIIIISTLFLLIGCGSLSSKSEHNIQINSPAPKSIDALKHKITALLANKKAQIGVAIISDDGEESLAVNGDLPMPMQSVFKFHVAVAVLAQIDQGKFSLTDKIRITPHDLDNDLWSPIRKRYPKGTTLTLAEIIKFTVANSDNVGCDVLIRLLGGPAAIESYFKQNGVVDIAVKYNEEVQQQVWQRQYQNWTTANAANLALKTFYQNTDQTLSAPSHKFLWQVMKSSKTGKRTIKGNLPKNTVVAHKTGHSGKNPQELTAAQNDIGIIFLPDGRYFYLSVFVSDSLETKVNNQKIIADIAELAWQHFSGAKT